MEIDVYGLCPCGSGKKVKFCCQDLLPDLERVAQLRGDNQNRLALQTLEKLEKSHPQNNWVLLQKAVVLLEEQRLDEAQATVEAVMKMQPVHPFAYVLRAMLALARGDEGVETLIEQAFEHASAPFADELGLLAAEMAYRQEDEGHLMAARQYLLSAAQLAMRDRDAAKESVQAVLAALAEFDRRKPFPFPLRCTYYVRIPEGPSAQDPQFEQAMQAVSHCAYRSASESFAKLAQKYGNVGVLWYDAGICAAWTGDDARAADFIRRAAQLDSNFDAAVELETLAQLLENCLEQNQLLSTVYQYKVHSVARLLTSLDGRNNYLRNPQETGPEAPPDLAASYRVVDPPFDPEAPLSAETIPEVIGQLSVRAEQEGIPAAAYLHIFPRYDAGRERQRLEEIAGAELEFLMEADGAAVVEKELAPLQFAWNFAPEVPGVQRRKLVKQKWDHNLSEVWPHLPLAALGGKTPLEAAGNDALKVPLAAALNVLEAFCDSRSFPLVVEADLRSRLKLPEPQPIAVTDTTNVTVMSLLEMRRLPLHELTDAQFNDVLPRGTRVGHMLLTYDLLTELLARTISLKDQDLSAIYAGLSDLCSNRGNRQEAFAWISKGREYARTTKNSFEQLISWDLKELMVRLEDPGDPQLMTLANHIWNDYGSKVPQLREQLAMLFQANRIPGPWQTGMGAGAPLVGVGAGTGSVGESGLWTPSSATEQPASGGKLWLPGQE